MAKSIKNKKISSGKRVSSPVTRKSKISVIKGNVVDVVSRKIFPGEITIKAGKILSINRISEELNNYILPGLVDGHIHIESTMLVPSRFAQTVAPHGTVAVVSDPHEIANVLGVKGINYMIKDAKKTPLKIYFTAPSCVPATEFETSGAKLTSDDVDMLLKIPEIVALGEVMNVRGVLKKDKELLAKLSAAKQNKKPIDGHCPLISGNDLQKYFKAGISTDHESTTDAEAAEKARIGMKIMIREGSSAKDLDALSRVGKNPRSTCFLVSDDLHADDLKKGHLNVLLRKAVSQGFNPIRAVQMVSLNPIKHYGLNVGLLRKGDPADMVVVDNLSDFNVLETWIEGSVVARGGRALFSVNVNPLKSAIIMKDKVASDFQVRNYSGKDRQIVRVIRAEDGSLLTKELHASLPIDNGLVIPDISKDVLKIAVVDRYGKNRIGLGFINGFGLKQGAVASSVSHDSHNIVVVGTNDADMARAINEIKHSGGGSFVIDNKVMAKISLPIAGLMSDKNVDSVAKDLERVNLEIRRLGCVMEKPLMTLSFMTLLVIPKLKISDGGLFDTDSFTFRSLFVEDIGLL